MYICREGVTIAHTELSLHYLTPILACCWFPISPVPCVIHIDKKTVWKKIKSNCNIANVMEKERIQYSVNFEGIGPNNVFPWLLSTIFTIQTNFILYKCSRIELRDLVRYHRCIWLQEMPWSSCNHLLDNKLSTTVLFISCFFRRNVVIGPGL